MNKFRFPYKDCHSHASSIAEKRDRLFRRCETPNYLRIPSGRCKDRARSCAPFLSLSRVPGILRTNDGPKVVVLWEGYDRGIELGVAGAGRGVPRTALRWGDGVALFIRSLR